MVEFVWLKFVWFWGVCLEGNLGTQMSLSSEPCTAKDNIRTIAQRGVDGEYARRSRLKEDAHLYRPRSARGVARNGRDG